MTITENRKPKKFSTIVSHMEKDKYMKVMQEEIKFLLDNQSYELVNLPKEKKTLKNKWAA